MGAFAVIDQLSHSVLTLRNGFGLFGETRSPISHFTPGRCASFIPTSTICIKAPRFFAPYLYNFGLKGTVTSSGT